MTSTKAPKKKSMTPSWDLLSPNFLLIRKHYVAIIYLMVLPSLVYLLGTTLLGNPIVDNKFAALSTTQSLGLWLMLLGGIWSLVNIGPVTYFLLHATSEPPAQITDYYRSGIRFSGRIFLYYIGYATLVIGGLLLLIVPGFIMFRRYFLGPYYLVANDLSLRETFKIAGERSKPVSGAIWGVIGVQVAFIFASSIFSAIPVVGIVLSQIASFACAFLAVLRYKEIES